MTRVVIDHHETIAAPGQTLFECAEAVGVLVPTSCVKQGKCRECLVEIESGERFLTPRSAEEAHLGETFRLACRARPIEDSDDGVVHCRTMRRGGLRIVDEASGLEPLAVEPREGFGLAIDVGTTTVALRLYDLSSGELRASQSFENPQRFGGSDIMARIHYDTTHKGRLLQRTLLGYLRQSLATLPVASEEIVELVVVGNSTMRDLFFGLDVHSIGQKPYRSTHEASLTAKASKLRLPLHPDASVYGLPIIGSHVGGDAAAALLATGMHERTGISVLMDIGTNTELIVGGRDRLMAASCPAGPAFEGGGVGCGMPALDGAIEHVELTPDGRFALSVIGDGEASGICGSGLIDLMSELLRSGRMNAQGRFAEGLEEVELSDRVVFTEPDVNELAQAKGANVAGLQIVRDAYGFSLDEVDRFFLAGGFAKHLDLDAARRIGLLPELADDKIRVVGNAALEGASRALLSASHRAEIERAVETIEHIELETHPDFFDFFVEGCQFVPIGAEVLDA